MVEEVRKSLPYYAATYRRTWRSTVLSSFVAPVAYLVGMGFGVGSVTQPGHAVAYTSQLFPGLAVLAAVSTAGAEGTYPVFARSARSGFHSVMKYTPLSISSIVLGQTCWIAMRAAAACCVFGIVGLACGVASLRGAATSVLIATAAGTAAALPMMAFSVSLRQAGALELGMRLVYAPMVLFSGALYPMHVAPPAYHAAAWFNPVWHAVEISRAVAGKADASAATSLHAAVITALAGGSFFLAVHCYGRRLRR
ncbi:ABC transporter permease [Streptomyces sp. NPDC046805]|uniref:ABC transporter permease n=1 Tax=Streptomyces sp. NPDC046805 TaxID=3155134 RepID=UPI0033F0CD5A